MFLFFGGTRVRQKTIGEGHHACPTCGVIRPHRRARVGNYVHLYWLPLFRVQDLGEVVICQHCGLVRSVEELTGKTDRDRATGEAAGETRGGGRTWECPACRNVNPGAELHCLRCGRRR